MATHTTPSITALQAQATATLFLSDHLPDRFTADQPWFDPQGACWHVPVILTYPGMGVLGTVGDIQVAAQTATVVAHRACGVMRYTAQGLYDAHRDAIDTAIIQAGDPLLLRPSVSAHGPGQRGTRGGGSDYTDPL